MVDQLLWAEMLLKLSAGLALLIAPAMTAAVLGLPRPGSAFWPRLLGAVLIGIGSASALQSMASGRGLALGGSIVINLAAAAFLLSFAVLRPPPARRGRALIWLLVASLFLLSLIEIAAAA
jgi:hypothetical protein